MKKSMPVIFFGHGNPLNTLLDNEFTKGWASLAATIPRPKAVLSISAHWFRTGTAVTAMPFPQTIHDFGGFPKELYEIYYPAPGEPDLAARVKQLITSTDVALDQDWGLDHGTWSVLRHVFPNAEIAVAQLSIDKAKPPIFHYQLGRQLSVLRDEGVLIVGSGNLVHNLHEYIWKGRDAKPFDWALRFENQVRKYLSSADDAALIEYEKLGRDAELAIPTPDHYLPFIYVLGARRKDDHLSFPVEGFDGGSVSMLAIRYG